MDLVISQLKKDFYSQVRSGKASERTASQSTLSVLTEEELQELENVWIELLLWKKQQNL